MIGIDWMLDDLKKMRLRVVLIPCQEEDNVCAMRRVAVEQNPVWYQDLCALHESNRKKRRHKKHPDTRIKRRNVLSILRTIQKRGASISKYADELLEIAAELERSVFDDTYNVRNGLQGSERTP